VDAREMNRDANKRAKRVRQLIAVRVQAWMEKHTPQLHHQMALTEEAV
jgi:hypothetical protein